MYRLDKEDKYVEKSSSVNFVQRIFRALKLP